ncbi:hypothetical protein [Sphingosinithalassobacter sp. CS137]|uniref:hypothetical protein n=1 Tax=Sphingosinithalassobacter sp. CS137 TaxID=2762748 RepID=UPI00165D86FE|nr:hypothetical protein [Sphingosinithalassobacter sp. CS137]
MIVSLAASLLLLAPGQDDPCFVPGSFAHWLEVPETPARQGATIPIRAMRGLPYAPEDEPEECSSAWRVTPADAAALAHDLRSFTIAEDADPGTIVTISYQVGEEPVTASVRVIGRDEVVLTGRRRQQSVSGCEGAEHVGELEFTGEGRFSVTYQPFERYRDYWGSYRYDPATGALEMTTDGGNRVPPDLDLSGRAYFNPDRRLILEGFNLGAQPSLQPPVCTYIF